MKTRKLGVVLTVLVGATLLPGCVSQDKYDTVADTNTTYQSRLEELHQEKRTLQNTVDRKQRRIDELEAEVSGLHSTSAELNQEIGDIRDQQRNISTRLGNLKLSLLDPDLDKALRQLARDNSELISYDSMEGMVRFKSDLTFGSGSDNVKPEGKAGLQKLTEILLQSDAPFEVQVVGHTDSQKISNPATKRAHPTNRHLSVHRAIAVSESMQTFGIPADQVMVAGWGSNRPSVPNNAKGGTAANRRVEIFIVGSGDVSPGDASSATADAPTRSTTEFPTK